MSKTSCRLLLGGGCLIAFSATAANLIKNPDFSDGVAGWTTDTTGNGTATLDPSTGSPLAPSIHLVSDPAAADVSVESSCMLLEDNGSDDLYMNIKGNAGFAIASINFYSDAACTTGISAIDSTSIPANSEWDTYSVVNIAPPDGTQSAKVVLTATMGASGAAADINFDHIEFGASGTVPAFVDVNQEGLSGTWFNPATSGQGFEFQFSPDTVTPGNGFMFGAWYTYDISAGSTDSQRWYSLQGPLMGDAEGATFNIYQNTGGNFDAPPITTANPVGTGTLMFDSCETGTFDFTLDDGRTGSIPIQRALPNVECVETGTPTIIASDFGFSGAWFDPATAGQGIVVEVNPNDANTFFGWYTYALNGVSSGASGQRWFTAQAPYTVGSTVIPLTLYTSTGGIFDSSGGVVTTDPVGSATLTFTSCTTATLSYTFSNGEFGGRTGSISLTRPGPALASCSVNSQ